MSQNSMIPKFRFQGFSEPWEERKLGEITTITKGKQINKSVLFDNGDYYVLNGGITPSGYTNNYNTEKDTISISEGGNSCGFVHYNSNRFWSGGHNYTLLNPKINNLYLYEFLKFKESFVMSLRVGSGLPNIQKNSLQEIKIFLPHIEEQERIGEFFSSLDSLIAFHQRKCEKLSNIKKALLDKMFPQGDCDMPRLRFQGFSEPWKERKLEEIGNIITGTTPSTADQKNYNGNYLFVSPADIQKNRYVENTITTLSDKGFNKCRIIAPHSILFVSIGSTIGKIAQIKERAATNQQINSIECYKQNNSNFIFSLLENQSNSIKLMASAQAVPIINKTFFKNIKLKISNAYEEQERIGEFFSSLDSLIALHQRKCEKLSNIKKALLDKMFI